MEYIITKEEEKERLDIFLVSKLRKLSRSQIQKIIKQGNVLVNNKKISPHYGLKEGDTVALNDAEKGEKPEKAVLSSKKPRIKLRIVSEKDDYMVINKPAGLIVHGAEHIKENTLVDEILKEFPKVKKVGDDAARPGIVHRLDKDVSGLMVIAKTNKFFNNLKKQFQERTVEKEYTALVYGKIDRDSGIISFPIQRSSSGRKMAALPMLKKGEENIEGKAALTEFKVVKKFINYTLLHVKIKTGRTHQIRAHMAAYGHPIVGDDVYSTNKTRLMNKKWNLGRVFLVADKLSFADAQKKKVSFSIILPKELKEFLKKVK